MRLMVEPPNATRESYSGPSSCCGALGNGRVLELGVEPQLMPNWCWAAVSASLARYYRVASTKNQRELAAAFLGLDPEAVKRDPDGPSRLDRKALLHQAIAVHDCFSHWSSGRPTFERVAREIEAGRPVCLSVRWWRGGAHYAVVSGYFSARRELQIEDSLYGSSLQAYDDFPGHYRGGGAWTGTFWTRPPAGGTSNKPFLEKSCEGRGANEPAFAHPSRQSTMKESRG